VHPPNESMKSIKSMLCSRKPIFCQTSSFSVVLMCSFCSFQIWWRVCPMPASDFFWLAYPFPSKSPNHLLELCRRFERYTLPLLIRSSPHYLEKQPQYFDPSYPNLDSCCFRFFCLDQLSLHSLRTCVRRHCDQMPVLPILLNQLHHSHNRQYTHLLRLGQ